jgi:hypothetical protein
MENKIEVYNDPDILELKIEYQKLEKYYSLLSDEKEEYEKLFFDFQHLHTIELGEIILEILRLRKLKFKSDKVRFEDAENDERNYKEQIDTDRSKFQYYLTSEEKKELKMKFRKATFLCHPDKVIDEFKHSAQNFFIELKLAYEANDIKGVTDILKELENGNCFKTKSETIQNKNKLNTEILNLKGLILKIQAELTKIKESESYNTIIDVSCWQDYFKDTKEKLTLELKALK